MKKAFIIYFSYPLQQAARIPNVQLYPNELVFGQTTTTVTLLTDDEEEINEVGLKDEVESLNISGEDAIYLCPSIVRERIQKIKLSDDPSFQKKSITTEQESELKRLVSEQIKVPVEKIQFDEISEFEFTQKEEQHTFTEEQEEELKHLISKKTGIALEQVTFDEIVQFIKELEQHTFTKEQEQKLKYLVSEKTGTVFEQVTFDNVVESFKKSQIVPFCWKKVVVAILIASVSLIGISWLGLQFLENGWKQRLAIGISEIEIARDHRQNNVSAPDVSKYVQIAQIAVGEMEAVEEYNKTNRCKITIQDGDSLSKLGLLEKDVAELLSIQDNLSAIKPLELLKGGTIILPRKFAEKLLQDRECK